MSLRQPVCIGPVSATESLVEACEHGRQAREQWDLPEMTVLNSAILDLVKLQEGATLHQPPGVSDVPCRV